MAKQPRRKQPKGQTAKSEAKPAGTVSGEQAPKSQTGAGERGEADNSTDEAKLREGMSEAVNGPPGTTADTPFPRSQATPTVSQDQTLTKQDDSDAQEHDATPSNAQTSDATQTDYVKDSAASGGGIGDVVSPPEEAVSSGGEGEKHHTREETQSDATRRWRNDGISEQVAAFRDRVRNDYREDNPGCKRREAHEYAWTSALAAFPPPGVDPVALEIPEPEPVEVEPEPIEPEPVAVMEIMPPADDAGVSGLGRIPGGWPVLPSNASLQAEVAWVQASRLDVVEETGSGTRVDLSRARSPAPSRAAIGWLETSIRAYSKYCDIAAKATQTQEHEAEAVRRERVALGDVRGLLESMGS